MGYVIQLPAKVRSIHLVAFITLVATMAPFNNVWGQNNNGRRRPYKPNDQSEYFDGSFHDKPPAPQTLPSLKKQDIHHYEQSWLGAVISRSAIDTGSAERTSFDGVVALSTRIRRINEGLVAGTASVAFARFDAQLGGGQRGVTGLIGGDLGLGVKFPWFTEDQGIMLRASTLVRVQGSELWREQRLGFPRAELGYQLQNRSVFFELLGTGAFWLAGRVDGWANPYPTSLAYSPSLGINGRLAWKGIYLEGEYDRSYLSGRNKNHLDRLDARLCSGARTFYLCTLIQQFAFEKDNNHLDGTTISIAIGYGETMWKNKLSYCMITPMSHSSQSKKP